MNEAIATVGSNALVLDTDRASELELEISMLTQRAESISVKDEATLNAAAELKKTLSKMKKTVEAEWEPYRVKTKSAYDSVIAGKKSMVSPLEKAEKMVTGEINAYAYEIEKKRIAEEAARQKAIEEAMAAKLEEAAKAETEGDAVGAEMAMAEAEVYDSLTTQTAPAPAKLSGSSMSQKVGWEIVTLVADMVPINISGQIVHMNNKAVVEQLVKKAIEQAGGNISIPGVTFRETMKVNVR